MKNNKPKTDETANDAAIQPIKTNRESFAVEFKALPYLTGKSTTPVEQYEARFVQSHIFADSIFKAIAEINDPLESGIVNGSGVVVNCTHHLALIGAAFVSEMEAQFQNLLELVEDKADGN